MQGIRARNDTGVLDVRWGVERTDNAADSVTYGLAVATGVEQASHGVGTELERLAAKLSEQGRRLETAIECNDRSGGSLRD